MSKSTLGQVLEAFKNNRGPLTLGQIARDLNISPVQLEGMIHFWVRKGKLRQSESFSNCGSCGHSESGCPFVLEMPHSYELIIGMESQAVAIEMTGHSCGHKT